MFRLKRSTAGTFSLLFLWYWAEKNLKVDNALFSNLYLWGVKTISNHAHNTASWYLLGGSLSKFQTSTPQCFSVRKFHSGLISHLIIWYLMPFQLPVNRSLVRELTLSLCFDQLQKIHFKAVTFHSLQISCTVLLAGSARGMSAYFQTRQGFSFSDSVKFLRGQLNLQKKVANW